MTIQKIDFSTATYLCNFNSGSTYIDNRLELLGSIYAKFGGWNGINCNRSFAIYEEIASILGG
jgi:hypothetical protein